ncbi:MAG: shikimate kinase [Chloroflexota bacterium]|nr:shikimate kinase [Chloroflexota bacterium]
MAFDDRVRELPAGALERPLALIGFMGVGKTTVASELARRLVCPMVDTDGLIESRAGRTIRELFDWFGEAHFRELERTIIAELDHASRQIVSLGGGAFMDATTRALLLDRCTVVYLAAPWEYVRGTLRRIQHSRPLLRGRSPSEIEGLFESRHPIYDQAHLRVLMAGRKPAQVAERILQLLQP